MLFPLRAILAAERPTRKDSRFEPAPFPMCFTPTALETLASTVGAQPAETGAKGFGPRERMGFDLVEFDERGSRRASGAVYSPDTQWGEARCHHWMSQEGDRMRLWTGDLHSHPGGMGMPSSKSGKALGDLGYAEEVFAANEWMQFFFMPILVNVGNPNVRIVPWVICRDDPHRPLLATCRICDPDEFPERIFNPAWESGLKQAEGPVSIDVSRLAELARANVAVREETEANRTSTILEVRQKSLRFVLRLPVNFPEEGPDIMLWEGRDVRPLPIKWDPSSRSDPELRLAAVCRRLSNLLDHRF